MKKHFLFVLSVSVFLFLSCSQVSQGGEIEDYSMGTDLKPPVLISVTAETETIVRLTFNETVIPYSSAFGFNNVFTDGCDVVIKLDSSLPAGKSRKLNGRVCDLNGNSCSVTVTVWGKNLYPAELEINEFTTKGSGASPDRTELKVTHSGSTAGFVLYDGIPGNFRNMVMIDDCQVKKGDFIVIWWTSSLPDGVFVHPSSDLWNICSFSQGLSENNGIITLASSPSEGAQVFDCIAYSTGESTQFEGWGTKEVFERVESAKMFNWLKTETVSPKNSTATRSVSKNPLTGKWYITDTGKSTFGQEN